MTDTKNVIGENEEKKLNMEELVAKGKKGDLSAVYARQEATVRTVHGTHTGSK